MKYLLMAALLALVLIVPALILAGVFYLANKYQVSIVSEEEPKK